MADEKYFMGVDWGEQEKSVATIVKVEGERVGVLQSFELGDREVSALRELGAPRDYVIPLKSSFTLPIKNLWVHPSLVMPLPFGKRNPPLWVLRRWWRWRLFKSNRSFKRTRIAQVRQMWRERAWNPSHKNLSDIHLPRFPMLEGNSLKDVGPIIEETGTIEYERWIPTFKEEE